MENLRSRLNPGDWDVLVELATRPIWIVGELPDSADLDALRSLDHHELVEARLVNVTPCFPLDEWQPFPQEWASPLRNKSLFPNGWEEVLTLTRRGNSNYVEIRVTELGKIELRRALIEVEAGARELAPRCLTSPLGGVKAETVEAARAGDWSLPMSKEEIRLRSGMHRHTFGHWWKKREAADEVYSISPQKHSIRLDSLDASLRQRIEKKA